MLLLNRMLCSTKKSWLFNFCNGDSFVFLIEHRVQSVCSLTLQCVVSGTSLSFQWISQHCVHVCFMCACVFYVCACVFCVCFMCVHVCFMCMYMCTHTCLWLWVCVCVCMHVYEPVTLVYTSENDIHKRFF